MVTSVTEGEDKPLKYPLMFRTCELVVVNKIDLMPHLDYDLEKFLANVDTVNPGARRCSSAPARARVSTPSASGSSGSGSGHRLARDPRRHAGGGRIEELLAARVEANEAFFES